MSERGLPVMDAILNDPVVLCTGFPEAMHRVCTTLGDAPLMSARTSAARSSNSWRDTKFSRCSLWSSTSATNALCFRRQTHSSLFSVKLQQQVKLLRTACTSRSVLPRQVNTAHHEASPGKSVYLCDWSRLYSGQPRRPNGNILSKISRNFLCTYQQPPAPLTIEKADSIVRFSIFADPGMLAAVFRTLSTRFERRA
jgi:hypothetical protein